jgi:CDP-glycerol glycerophosphotransferase
MIQDIKRRINKIIFRFFPIYPYTVLFRSFQGMYNDNPRYISESLHEKDDTIRIIWVLNSDEHVVPEYVKVVHFDSPDYIKYLSRSQVVVDNYFGINGKIASAIDLSWMMRRKNRLNISTWHGTPIKKIFRDEPGKTKKDSIGRVSDFILAGCKYTAQILNQAFCDDYPVLLIGTPRNDVLINQSLNIDKIKQKLRLPIDKKIVLFAPTFRNSVEESGINQMKSINFDILFETLHIQFGDEWCFVFRVHNEVLDAIDVKKWTDKFGDRFVNGNIGEDMAEYLACIDILITDYSGSMYDFALTGKPCFLFAPDRNHYENVERGFYYDYDELPFPKAYSSNELIDCLEHFNYDEYKQQINAFLKQIGNVESGKASDKVSDMIIDFMYHGRKDWKKYL